jgi:hypothetical protein
MKQVVIIILAFCFGFSCRHHRKSVSLKIPVHTYKDPYTMIDEGLQLVREGDLVTRLNTDPSSQYLKNFNRHDKKFSHAGIVLFENGKPCVYHIINGEENPDEKIKKDSLKGFCDPRKNFAFGIFRYKIKPTEIEKLKKLIRQWYKQGIQFDSTFNLKTDDRMYCSEMIYKALARVTNKRIVFETTRPSFTEAKFLSLYMQCPFSYISHLEIVCIDNLYSNRFCRLVKEYDYEHQFP